MSARAKLPPHGTSRRYRLELKAKRDGKSKTGACDRCRSAETERRARRRVDASARDARSKFTVVGDPVEERTPEADNPADTQPTGPSRRVGDMERAVQDDIDEIDPSMHVPFHRSLSVLALELAAEIDEPATAATARRDARKQLFEVLRSLRTQKEGDDGSALTVLLEQAGFGTPVVPGRSS